MIQRKRLFWQLFPSYVGIIVLALVAVSLLALSSMKSFYHQQTLQDLESLAKVMGLRVGSLMEEGSPPDIDAYCKASSFSSGSRVTVIDREGWVLGDSTRDSASMENHGARPEVVKALEGVTGSSIRFSATLSTNMMYVATPIEQDNVVYGVVRTALPMTALEGEVRSVQRRIAFWGLMTALVAGFISLVVSRKISLPISDMQRSARLFAEGDFSHKLYVPDSLEIGGLAESMNLMAHQLDERIKTTTRQRNEMEAVLSSMAEGVMAVDADFSIISMNAAAHGIFGLVPGEAVGFGVSEAIRNIAFIRFVEKAAGTEEAMDQDIKLWDNRETLLHSRSTPLKGVGEVRLGTLIVFNDVTRMRRLESMRRDFAANASHEMRTPLTCIKGAVETILLEKEKISDSHERFYTIIEKNVDRMSHLIEDLLELSRIEQQQGSLSLTPSQVDGVLETSLLLLAGSAEAREVAIEVTGDKGVLATFDSMLLERAVVNLLDNAIKYSPARSTVTVSVAKVKERVEIRVSDQGCGIPAEHIPRLFERFYRVDGARSRKLGGTGLGLAIVKHVMQLLGGEVRVESTPEKGSTFTLVVPT
ncbi:ATP-binding protein [Desulfoluna spongiiphila]|uniref:histidine kinase n=1 Tax=Desulfoluna spongiiphila TaxID=419481 RepID=A0A1G5GVR4_9BACT|nr:ATP-binding protein [Desulfoluna spongiiphila]SCY55682.1 two-component system, OmpR family, phosphate regulon sensor histidine kinase PhoR [Desulfoluna spongiiphila]